MQFWRREQLLAVVAAVGVSWSAVGATADWRRWRGPHQDGSTTSDGLLAVDPIAMTVLWRRPIGSGYSGIAIADGRAVTAFSAGADDVVAAFDVANGDELWRFRLEPSNPGRDGSEAGPISTPVIDAAGVVYMLAAGGRLVALDPARGSLRWSRDLAADLAGVGSHFGYATTPLIVDDLVVVALGAPEAAVVALDRASGEVRWRAGRDRIEYQSPILVELAGRRQIVAIGGNLLTGLDPATGAVLWSYDYAPEDRWATANVVPIGHDRLLVGGSRDSLLLTYTGDAADPVRPEWTESTLDARLSTTVHHGGHLYGFDGRFLSCVDAATGKKVWKSRPPGGGGLIRVDDDLVIYGAKGDVVLVRASPAGYQERARVSVAAPEGATYPSFAGGNIFVRNGKELACIGFRGGKPATVEPQGPTEPGPLGRLLQDIEAAPVKRVVVDEFMASHPRLPLVESSGRVHFVYRGIAEDVGVESSLSDWGEEPLQLIEGTDLRYRSVDVDPKLRIEYRFNVDFERVGPDPANPLRVPAEWGADYSELRMPECPTPAHRAVFRGQSAGRFEEHQVPSRHLGGDRRIQVYLPAGYGADDRRYPLVVFTEARGWIDKAALGNSLDHLFAAGADPTVVVAVDGPEGSAAAELAGAKLEAFASFLGEEVLPSLSSRYRLSADPATRTLAGRWSGGYAAVAITWAHPSWFGRAWAQSILPGDLLAPLLERIAGADRPSPVRFDISWNRYERWDAADHSRKIAEALTAAGHQVGGGERLDSAGWGAWRDALGELFAARQDGLP